MKIAAKILRQQFSKPPETNENKKNNENYPKCRFVQYTRNNDGVKRLGMVSDDGTKMMPLSDVTCASPDMVEFIKQRYSIGKLLGNVKYIPREKINDNIRLLPPITNPNKIIGVAHNYKDNCSQENMLEPKEPEFYTKSTTAIVGALDPIFAHKIAKRIDYENQLAVVIGRTARCVSCSEAMKYVFGYTIAQDITARDLTRGNNSWQYMLGKSLDTFCPLGPAIVHKYHIRDVHNLWIKTYVNGEERQDSSTNNMIFKIDYLIHRLSQFMTLRAGDIILTGTPAGVAAHMAKDYYLKPGDVIESEIQGLGRMKNIVTEPI